MNGVSRYKPAVGARRCIWAQRTAKHSIQRENGSTAQQSMEGSTALGTAEHGVPLLREAGRYWIRDTQEGQDCTRRKKSFKGMKVLTWKLRETTEESEKLIICKKAELVMRWVSTLVSSVTQSCPTLCDPMDCSTPVPCPSPTPRVYSFMSIKSVMASNHLILCHPLLLPPSILPRIRVLSNEAVLHIRWPKDWSFSFSISPSNEYLGLISFRMD